MYTSVRLCYINILNPEWNTIDVFLYKTVSQKKMQVVLDHILRKLIFSILFGMEMFSCNNLIAILGGPSMNFTMMNKNPII